MGTQDKTSDSASSLGPRRLTERPAAGAYDAADLRQIDRDPAGRRPRGQESWRLHSLVTLVACIAHDFSNCLTAIQLNAALLETEVAENSPNRHALADIVRLARTGTRMSRRLMDYARGEPERFGTVQLMEVVREICDTFSHLHTGIEVSVEGPTELPSLTAARGQIEQLLFNLLFNSADAMPDGGSVHVRLSVADDRALGTRPDPVRPGQWLRLEVADTGRGIAPELLPKIFDRFFTTKDTHGRAGLGLASVYLCVRAHGGFVDLDSTPGHGTTFTVWLPVEVGEDPHGAQGRI